MSSRYKKIGYKQINRKIKKEGEARVHYEELLVSAVSELKFEKLRNEHFHSVLNKVKELEKAGVHPNLIRLVIENEFERDSLNRNIHNHLIGKSF